MSVVYREQISVEPGSVELIIARGMTARDLLGEDYTADPHGKPVVPGRSISISHVEDVLALAIRTRGRIGVDVEFPSPDNAPAQADFTRVWTAKEAISKALGLGAAVDLSQIEIRSDRDGMKFASLYENPDLAKGWKVVRRQVKVSGKLLIVAIVYDEAI